MRFHVQIMTDSGWLTVFRTTDRLDAWAERCAHARYGTIVRIQSRPVDEHGRLVSEDA